MSPAWVQEWTPLLACALAFLLGSVPFGLWVARIFHVKNLRTQGSGNIGATNVARVAGFWPAGALTFFLDVVKGMLPVFLVRPQGIGIWAGALHLPDLELGMNLPWMAGFFAVLGHCFSPWLYFRGGKGVATGFGAIALLSPWAALCGLLAFGLVFSIRRIGSLASLSGLAVASVSHLVLYPSGPYLLPGALLIATIVFRHESNIDALLENRERVF
jgi:acyl phosphate:glycerol-3-phosphate acyltransferase